MAFTRHGHPIPWTVLKGEPPEAIECGGPGVCGPCSADVINYQYSDEERFVRAMKDLLDSGLNFEQSIQAVFKLGSYDVELRGPEDESEEPGPPITEA